MYRDDLCELALILNNYTTGRIKEDFVKNLCEKQLSVIIDIVNVHLQKKYSHRLITDKFMDNHIFAKLFTSNRFYIPLHYLNQDVVNTAVYSSNILCNFDKIPPQYLNEHICFIYLAKSVSGSLNSVNYFFNKIPDRLKTLQICKLYLRLNNSTIADIQKSIIVVNSEGSFLEKSFTLSELQPYLSPSSYSFYLNLLKQYSSDISSYFKKIPDECLYTEICKLYIRMVGAKGISDIPKRFIDDINNDELCSMSIRYIL